MDVDPTAAARRADDAEARIWLAEQRVFISSALADTSAERRALAVAIEAEGARPVWFEELGRDASSEEAYLTGVDSSTIYVAILSELYGTTLETGFSPTEAEYERAREGGKRLVVCVAGQADQREGHLRRFIDRVRVFLTTESYADPDDLTRRVRRRLHELAAEALSPWVKLGSLVFRADLIQERDDVVLLHARVNDDMAFAIEQLRGQQWGRARVRLTYAASVVDGEIASVQRTIRAGGSSTLEITLEHLSEGGTPYHPPRAWVPSGRNQHARRRFRGGRLRRKGPRHAGAFSTKSSYTVRGVDVRGLVDGQRSRQEKRTGNEARADCSGSVVPRHRRSARTLALAVARVGADRPVPHRE